MTGQEIFDKVSVHLLTQNAKSFLSDMPKNDTPCAYRGQNGMKCAVGVLIKDEFYTPDLEDENINNDAVYRAVIRSVSISDDYSRVLQEEHQWTHDAYDTSEWKDRLIEVAHNFHLDPSVVEKFNAA